MLVLSTGVIGVKLPMPKLLAGLAEIGLSPDGGDEAAEAILTTDTYAKEAVVSRGGLHGRRDGEGRRDDPPVPRDDARGRHHRLPARAGEAHGFLKRAVSESFNRISVDGECSTNDAVLLLANGASGIERTRADRPRVRRRALARSAPTSRGRSSWTARARPSLLEIEVTGAASPGEADAVARRIATSPLVKTAAFGRDPNWGRILAAAGSAFVAGGFAQVDVDALTLQHERRHASSPHGEPTGAEVPLEGAVCTIELDLGLGKASASYLASDLTYDYVRINAEYTT